MRSGIKTAGKNTLTKSKVNKIWHRKSSIYFMHNSVFLREAVEGLSVKNGGKYIDATYGVGGHSRRIVDLGGRVLAIELDPEVKLSESKVIRLVHGNFSDIKQIALQHSWSPAEGIIFDFGLSMEQLDNSRKGFSFKKDHEPLDMRISARGMTAAEVLNQFSESDLQELIPRFSEEITATRIVSEIIKIRKKQPVTTVLSLKKVIDRVTKSIRYDIYSRIFQSLRMIVNDEIENIRKGLTGAMEIIAAEGKIVVISFHSIEDREVKRVVKQFPQFKETRIKVEKQRRLAPYEGSARLRIIEKI